MLFRSQMIEEGKFRMDLYYRINVFPIYVPPLRERKSDMLELADYFLEKYSQQNGKKVVRLSTPAIDMLMAYHWPGNVRELENVIRRALVVAKGDAILLSDLPAEVTGEGPTGGGGAAVSRPAGEGSASDIVALARQLFQWARRDPKLKVMPAVERELVIQALKEANGNQVHAAKLLGITRATLRKRVEKFGIQRELNIT